MSDPVRTTLLKDLESVLAQVPGLATVRRDFDLPLDLAAVDPATQQKLCPTPALFFWGEPEDSEDNNLITENKFNLLLVVYQELAGVLGDGRTPTFQEFADAAEVLVLPLKSALSNRDNFAHWQGLGLLDLELTGLSKALASADYGETVLTYRLTFWHRLGDAGSLNLQ